MRIFWSVCLLVLIAASGPALAQNAPKQLYNKSITTSFGIAQALKAPDGRIINPGFQRETHIYISSAGRLFIKSAGHSSRGASQTRHRGPGESSPDRALHFEGNRMVGSFQMLSGASRSVVTFDPSYTSCTLSVLFGKEEGKAMKTKGVDGVIYEVISFSAVHPSCKIQDGNVFSK